MWISSKPRRPRILVPANVILEGKRCFQTVGKSSSSYSDGQNPPQMSSCWPLDVKKTKQNTTTTKNSAWRPGKEFDILGPASEENPCMPHVLVAQSSRDIEFFQPVHHRSSQQPAVCPVFLKSPRKTDPWKQYSLAQRLWIVPELTFKKITKRGK